MGTQLTRWDGMIAMVTGALLLVWWIPVATLLPTLDPTVEILDIVEDALWMPLNVAGMVAAILLPGVLVSFYLAQKGTISKAGQVGFYLSLLGAVMFAWAQSEQTLMWPRLAAEAPELVDFEFFLLGELRFDVLYWPSYVFLGIGLFLFGRSTASAGVFHRWAGHLLWFGGITFGLSGIAFGLRFLAVLAFGSALIWMGYLQWRDRASAW